MSLLLYVGGPLLLIAISRLLAIIPEIVNKKPLGGSETLRLQLGDLVSTFDNLKGAESFFEDQQGNVYTGLADGNIVRLHANSGEVNVITRLGKSSADCGSFDAMARCGRPLGMALNPLNADELIVCDGMHRGLLSVNLLTGAKTTLIADIDGAPIRFCNSLTITPNGIVLFTQSDAHFMIPDFLKSVLSVRPSGRLIEFNLQTGKGRVILGGLHFANGVLLSPNGSALYVSDMARGRLLRLTAVVESETIERALLEVPSPNASPLRQSLVMETDVIIDNLSVNPFNGNVLFATSSALKLHKIVRMLGLGSVVSLIPLPTLMKFIPVENSDSFLVELNPETGNVAAIYEDPNRGLAHLSEGYLAYKNPDSIFFGRVLSGSFDPTTPAKMHRFPYGGEVRIPISARQSEEVHPEIEEVLSDVVVEA